MQFSIKDLFFNYKINIFILNLFVYNLNCNNKLELIKSLL